jgi:hypothetical protein
MLREAPYRFRDIDVAVRPLGFFNPITVPVSACVASTIIYGYIRIGV